MFGSQYGGYIILNFCSFFFSGEVSIFCVLFHVLFMSNYITVPYTIKIVCGYNIKKLSQITTMGNLFCCIQVDQSTVAIKGNFGKYDDVLGPGCHCVPWFIGHQIAGKLSLRVQQLDVRCETKTKVCFPFCLIQCVSLIHSNLNQLCSLLSYFCLYEFFCRKYTK